MTKSVGHTRNMTTGDPIRLILTFAIPMLIGNIFQQFYNMVDTMVVGRCLGDTAIAAIGATASLYSLIINFANGLNNGYGIIVTQRFGAQDRQQLKQAIAGMMTLNLSLALVLTGVSLALLKHLMVFLNTPADIFQMAYQYIFAIICGITATLGYNMFSAILRAMGNSRTPLYFLILASLLNIGLDLLFVAVFRWGVAGAAGATVIAQAVSALLSGWYVFRNYRPFLPEKADFRVPASMLKTLFSSGIAMGLMSCVVDAGNVILGRTNNLLGEVYIAAYAAQRKLLVIMIQPQATLAAANSTFIGQNWGAKKFERIHKTMLKVWGMELLWGITASTVIFLFGGPLVQFLTGTQDQSVLQNAVLSLRIHFATFPFLGLIFSTRNALQAMGHKIAPITSSAIELVLKIFAASILIPKLGFLGTCLTEPIIWCCMSTFLVGYYFIRAKKTLR